MSKELVYTINNDAELSKMFECIDKVKKALPGGPVVVTLGREAKSRDQEKKYHAMINDIMTTVELGQQYSIEAWKALLVDEFEQDLRRIGESLPKPSKLVISLDGQRAVTIRASTKDFKKEHASMFITFLYAWGTEHGARFSDESLRYYDEMKRG